jgi:plasmid stabilization system protein ParE
MKFTVALAPLAIEDLRRFDAWLTLRNPKMAIRLADLFEEALESLKEHPMRGRLVDDPLRELNLPFGKHAYILRYSIIGRNVFVARIWHSLEDR